MTGASGYIGGRLVPRLLDAGWSVRCLTRDPAKLDGVDWRDRVEVVQGDLIDGLGPEVMDGCDRGFYLVHSMEKPGEDFADRDRVAAQNFVEAAERSAMERIVYLGGLGEGELSDHLASRQEVGRILADGSVPVTELRAAVIIGSGSVSFEMLRYLTEVLPMMVTPKWVDTECQPIAVADVLEILVAATAQDTPEGVVEIGGPERLTYKEMMRRYAKVAGLPKRVIVPVPVLTPRLSSLWVGLVTPLPTGVARPLVDSLRNEVTVKDNSFAETAAAPLIGYDEAVDRALNRSKDLDVVTRWSGASLSPARALPNDPDWAGGSVETDTQVVATTASKADLFWAFTRIGGGVGYYTMNWAWGIRGLIDSLVGGVGLRRGRRHPERLRPGEALDFWRVVKVVEGRELQLNAEMRLPGEAWLSFEASGEDGQAVLTQEAVFVPKGLVGRLYWWAMFPFHLFIFKRMAARIAAAAENRAKG